ncbi:MAG: L,D-transpeptidase family protein, partial [Pseudomonadota bacterium]
RAGIVETATSSAVVAAESVAPLTLARSADLIADPASVAALALEDRIANLFAEDAASPSEIEALLSFYAERAFEPLWTDDAGLTPTAARIGDWLSTAADDGLDPAAYPMPRLSRLRARNADIRAKAEVAIALSVIRYADHAQAGTLRPQDVSRIIDVTVARPDPRATLDAVATAEDPALALDAFNPPHAGYRALRKALITMNEAREIPVVEVPPGRTLRRGIADPRVTLLRERLGVLEQGDSNDTEAVFDETLESAVRAFQAENGLLADGIVGPRTLAALNGSAGARRESIIANMERWRWLPRDLGTRYVHVNIPEYRVWMMEPDGDAGYEASYTGRVVVGKPKNATPIFSDEIEHVVTNPYWNVPYSIASGEMLPKLKRDPGYYAKRGYDTISASGKIVNPYNVNWNAISARRLGYRFRQRPGRNNALGNVKFLFPNDHAVYLHDTNARSLFSRSQRAFSHGCVRLHEPFVFAEALLASEPKFSAGSLKRSLGGKERWFNTTDHIPVHITYFTVVADESGELDFAGDIYGIDRQTQRLMGLI